MCIDDKAVEGQNDRLSSGERGIDAFRAHSTQIIKEG